jgi:hypothetical protein
MGRTVQFHFSLLLTMMGHAPLMGPKRSTAGADMSGTTASAPDSASPISPAPPAAPPTGYRISILPAALEISARLSTADELQNLVKILQANAAIWGTVVKNDSP